MTSSDDPINEMAPFLSPDHAERLLAGTDAPDDLPDGAARVAQLFSALGSPATVGDLAGEQRAVAAVAAAISQAPVSLTAHRRRRMLPQRWSAKAAAVATAAVLAGTTAAAAATGSLPDPAQKAVSRTLSHVHISVPNPDHHPRGHTAGTGKANATGPDATGAAKFGLCTAWAAGPSTTNPNSHKDTSVAFSNLQKAADAAGLSVADYCKDVHPPKTVDTPPTSTLSPSVTTEHGPPVSTPNRGGTGTANTASNGASNAGTSNTPPAAGAGSGNADKHPGGRPSGDASGRLRPKGAVALTPFRAAAP